MRAALARSAGLSLLAFLLISGTVTPVAVVIALMLLAVPSIHTLFEASTEKSAQSVSNSDPALRQWALETTRHLPGHPQVARALERYVRGTGGFDKIEAPWDPSTVEEVERILEEAAKSPPPEPAPATLGVKITTRKGEVIRAATIDDVAGVFGSDDWARNRLAQLKAGSPPRFSDRVSAAYRVPSHLIGSDGARGRYGDPPHRVERELLRQARLARRKHLPDKPKHGRLDA